MKKLEKAYFTLTVIWYILAVVLFISVILSIGMVSTSDFYTIELKQRVPEFSTFIKIQPIIGIVVGLILVFVGNVREAILDEYKYRKELHRRREFRGLI